jgi:hypothetical protein
MAARINLQESACCKAPMKTCCDRSGRYYLKCTRCDRQPGDPLPAPAVRPETRRTR